jgi:uncharacterized integral membrane protein
MEPKSPAIRRNETDEHIILVIHDAVQQSGFSYYMIGDIILTDKRFYYIEYLTMTDPTHLLFGLVGGVIAAITENKRIAKYREDANRFRRSSYGLTISERTAKTQPFKTMILTSAEVKNMKVRSETQIALDTQKKSKYHYLVPAMDAATQVAVNNWPNSDPLYEIASDPDGFFVGTSSPKGILERIAKGDSGAVKEIYQLGLDSRYITRIFANLQTITAEPRGIVMGKFTAAPIEFRDALLAVANKVKRDSTRGIMMGCVFAVIFALMIIQAITSFTFGLVLVAIFSMVLALAMFFTWARAGRVAKETNKQLEGKN